MSSSTTNGETVRIAMWSGPRNISTAMLRAWENRPDTFVSDEPFYAAYLAATGFDHPGAAEIIAAYPTDWQTVIDYVCGSTPDGEPVWYQKQMTHHILPDMNLAWTAHLVNCFLIRSPEEMITSYIKVRPEPSLQDLGLVEQRRIFDHVRAATGTIPPVLDSRDVLMNPEGMLRLLCEAVNVPFSAKMLAWPPGTRASDGVWAPYWYSSVETSTGFAPYRTKEERVPARLQPLLAQCNELYAEMYNHRLR